MRHYCKNHKPHYKKTPGRWCGFSPERKNFHESGTIPSCQEGYSSLRKGESMIPPYLLCFFFFLFFPAGLCRVDQQNACTRIIPINAPMLSMPTSFTEGPLPPTKD